MRLCVTFSLACLLLTSACSKKPAAPREKNTAAYLKDLGNLLDERVRINAAHALGRSHDAGVVDALLASLEDPSGNVQVAVVEALGQLADPKAVEPLCAAVQDNGRGERVRLAAVRALPEFKDNRAIQPLVNALKIHYGKQETAAALTAFGSDAVQPLIPALRETDTRIPAAEALATIGAPAVGPLIELLREDRSRNVKVIVARALSEIPDPRATEAVEQELKRSNQDPEIVAAVYRYLIRKGRPGTEKVLINALNRFGRLSMVEDYLASGNDLLKAAASLKEAQQYSTVETDKRVRSALQWGVDDKGSKSFLFHFDRSLASSSGIQPAVMQKVGFVPGKWGTALAIEPGGDLSYPATDLLNFSEMTVEMWVSPTADGNDPIYPKYNHVLMIYQTKSGDAFYIDASPIRTFFSAASVAGKFYGVGGGNYASWKAGSWHHLAYTHSVSRKRKRFFVDGILVQEVSGAVKMPAAEGGTFRIDSYGDWPAFRMDELYILHDEKAPAAIQFDALRKDPMPEREVVLIGTF